MRACVLSLCTLFFCTVIALPGAIALDEILQTAGDPIQAAPTDQTSPPDTPLKIPEPVICPCQTQGSSPREGAVSLEIECHSGTPLVLEFVLKDSIKKVRSISFDFESDGQTDLTLLDVREGVVFRGIPYREKGTYRLSAYLETGQASLKREYLISFVDFLWGRDNFNFANDGKFENAIEFVSKTVIEWAEDRFGGLIGDQEMLIRYLMYSLYKGSIGRCYGFTGLQISSIENPDLIPAPYRSVYSIEERDERVIRVMEWLQNDMVFANFVSGRKRLTGSLNMEDLRAELKEIMQGILRGRLIIFGYIGSELHHSMVAYGFFEDLTEGKTTLLTANNWVREQKDNVYSEDAENIIIDLKNEEQPITWFDLTKKKYRHIERFFAIEKQENYELNRNDFLTLLRSTEDRIIKNERVIIMVENVEEAYVVDEAGNKTGYQKGEIRREAEAVFFKKVDFNYVFEVPLTEPSTLVLNKRVFNKERGAYKEVYLYGIIPTPSGFQPVVLTRLPVPFLSELTLSVSKNGIAAGKSAAQF